MCIVNPAAAGKKQSPYDQLVSLGKQRSPADSLTAGNPQVRARQQAMDALSKQILADFDKANAVEKDYEALAKKYNIDPSFVYNKGVSPTQSQGGNRMSPQNQGVNGIFGPGRAATLTDYGKQLVERDEQITAALGARRRGKGKNSPANSSVDDSIRQTIAAGAGLQPDKTSSTVADTLATRRRVKV